VSCSQVTSPAALNIGIADGVQVDNFNTIGANRLLVFTGIAVNSIFVGHDDNVARGVVRVRLQFPVPKSMIFKASATLAALAGLHGEGDEDLTFSADSAVTVTDPTDGGTLPQPSQPLPNNELYAIIDVAYQGDGSRLTRVSYQANVLVQDLEPDIDSILVRPAGNGAFAPSASITVGGIDRPLRFPIEPDRSGTARGGFWRACKFLRPEQCATEGHGIYGERGIQH
jgi:hypothetical protein